MDCRHSRIEAHQFAFDCCDLLHILCTERDVIGASGAGQPGPKTRGVANIDDVACIRNEPGYCGALRMRAVTEVALYEIGGLLGRLGQDGRPTEASDGMLGGNVRSRPWRCRQEVRPDELQADTVGVAKAKHWLAELLKGAFSLQAETQRPCQPEADAFRLYSERYFADLAMPDASG